MRGLTQRYKDTKCRTETEQPFVSSCENIALRDLARVARSSRP